MPNNSTFPKSQEDISSLKQTATDAVNDLTGSATDHVVRAKAQLKDLAGHVQEETVGRVKGGLDDLIASARDSISDRPLRWVGAALALGFVFGFFHGRGSKD